ncbi:UDP-glucoronosyl and UDP-glucosyl transferase [Oesophagostomum dentatum]|uniref:glucuronosyltransferase n=1 Tax=Oesophagostomum dentatum TaxID=61180 RepID=A0A0B1SR38_OESDE|nr:UDP-glucoronosyl and UDP-glucosyl transferase [Oesophagostomum dentatum]
MLTIFYLLIFSIFSIICDSYKILIVNPKIGYSHMNFMGKIADTLVDAGHDVVTLQPVLFNLPSNGTKKSRLIQINAGLSPEQLAVAAQNHDRTWTLSSTNPLNVNRFNNMFVHFIKTTISKTLEEKELMEQLKRENFDVGIAELFDFAGLVVFEAIGLGNIIGTHSSSILEGTAYSIGVPVIPSFMPASHGITDDSTSLSNRAVNLLFTYLSWVFQDFQAKRSSSLQKWNRILNLRNRTILISFGSIAPCALMPAGMKNAIVEVAKSYPDTTFIWKYEKPDDAQFADGVENLVLSKWTPQNDLLGRHPMKPDDRLTLFVTHGGAGSLMESASLGKPLVVVPLFGDQVRNAKLVEKFGFGLILDKASLMNNRALRNAIDKVLNNRKYREAAHRIRDILAKRPFSPEQKLVKTVELAAEFGEMPELRVTGRRLGFITYYNLDIWFLLTLICVLTVGTMTLFVQRFFSKIRSIVKVKEQ